MRVTRHWVDGLVCGIAALAFSCSGTERSTVRDDAVVHERADSLAHEILIVDTHLDVPHHVLERPVDIAERTLTTDFDYPRAIDGGLACAFFAVFVSHTYETGGGARAFAEQTITGIEQLVARRPDRFALVRTPDEVAPARKRGAVAIALGVENGAPLEGNLDNIRHFFDRGVRYITLTHVRSNHVCDASWDTERPWNGLSPFGKRVVVEMNRVGMIIDISHVSDSAAFEVLRLSRAPVLATHSSCRFFTPGFERNISDDLIRAVAARGGVVDINFGSEFLVDSIRLANGKASADIRKYYSDHNLKSTDEEAVRYARSYRQDHGIPYADVRNVADHIDHVVQLVGIDYVGIGSDFDGLGDDLPTGLKDVSGYPNIIAELLKRGYSREAIEKVCSENVFRVWREVERVAKEMQSL
jgi:membrane dipeptidase